MAHLAPLRLLGGFAAAAALVAVVWIARLPDMAACRASGRTVDPTERHCLSADGYQQLQAHAIFHATHVIVVGTVVLAALVSVRHLVRRRHTRRQLA